MIDKREAKNLRARLERVAKGLGPDEKFWLEVHSLRHRRRGGRWKAAICRHRDAGEAFSGTSADRVVFSLDYPSQLPDWLEALGVRPVQPMPEDWNDITVFGCDVEAHEKETARP
ncbi:hypothetical protein [Sinomonas gamaensis]|uniref:hypothetical protein n=1 Tax=Sinomonas gamaensis TaxID=2565624 RepID=UPI001108A933|nr:hypothetical protein [Sinomonas gamaensis]